MKTPTNVLVLAAAFFALALSPLSAGEIPLKDCPKPVQDTVNSNLRGGKLDEVNVVTVAGRTRYVAEVDLSRDHDLKLYVDADGTLVKTKEDIDLSAAPVAVQEAAKKLTPADGKIDDVDKETEGSKVVYHVEIDRTNAADLNVVFAEDGAIISQREDS